MDKEQLSAETTETTELETEVEEVVEDADNDNDVEFSDDEGEDESEGDAPEQEADEPKEQPKSWKNQDNATAAKLRRERERKEQERRVESERIRHEAIKEALDGVNPYTGEPITDKADIEEYLIMKEIAKAGKDPIADYSRYVKEKAREQSKTETKTADFGEKAQKDKEDFLAKYPKEDIGKLLGDDMFRTFAKGKLGEIPLVELYEGYLAFEKKAEEKAKARAAQILANKTAAPKLSKQPQNSKLVGKMSSSEIEDMVDRVKRGEKIKL